MKLIVEQIVQVTTLAPRLKKVRLASFDVDMPPVSIGDELWFINIDESKQRTRLIAFDLRMAIDEHSIYVIIDAVTPELRGRMSKMGFDLAAYRKLVGDVEQSAPDQVEIES